MLTVSRGRLPFVIAQTGRSGSGYISQVFSQSGLPVGHEEWFNPFGTKRRGLIGDSSWCSVWWIDNNWYDGTIYYQTRDTMKTINSLANREFELTKGSAYYNLRAQIMGGDISSDPVVNAMRCYNVFSDICEGKFHMHWRVESVNARLVCDVARAHRIILNEAKVASVLATVPKDYNKYPSGPGLTFGDLPEGPDKDQVYFFMERYGYLC